MVGISTLAGDEPFMRAFARALRRADAALKRATGQERPEACPRGRIVPLRRPRKPIEESAVFKAL